jgi:hypothetical protein
MLHEVVLASHGVVCALGLVVEVLELVSQLGLVQAVSWATQSQDSTSHLVLDTTDAYRGGDPFEREFSSDMESIESTDLVCVSGLLFLLPIVRVNAD